MAKELEEQVETGVQSLEEKSVSWWSQFHSVAEPDRAGEEEPVLAFPLLPGGHQGR